MNLSQEDWVAQLEADENAVILDVRTDDEFNVECCKIWAVVFHKMLIVIVTLCEPGFAGKNSFKALPARSFRITKNKNLRGKLTHNFLKTMGIRILVFYVTIPTANYAHFRHYCGKEVNKAYNYL